jgi:subtilisin
VLFGFSASVPEPVLNALQNNPRVDYVEIDRLAFASAPPWCGENDPHSACKGDGGGEDPAPPEGQVVPWGIQRTGVYDEIGDFININDNTGAGINVYVLDTGIDIGHPDLIVNDRVDCTGNGPCVVDQGEADDKNGHGTHVAGTIAAQNNSIGVVGMAPGVILHAVQVLGNSGRGSFSGIIAGIDWVAAQDVGPSVINMSLGGSGSKTSSCGNDILPEGDAFHLAICKATNSGVVVVVAAGNSGDDANNHVPAAYDDTVITVSATDINDNWPSFSNYGSAVAIAAPGVGILSTWKGGGTNSISGTSMASPHVAGAAALWLKSNPQAPDYTAYTNTRAALIGMAQPITPTALHDEKLLDAGSL